jgi:hypothetical protein
MDCLAVRDRLAEYSLFLVDQEERGALDRHLEWCAGCRKEAGEMLEGAAQVGLALEPTEPPPSLERRVVDAVTAATRRRSTGRRVGLMAVATVAAGVVAVAAVAWGAIMASRAQQVDAELQRVEDRATQAEIQARDIARRLKLVLQEFPVPNEEIRNVPLGPRAPFKGGGAAVLVNSRNQHWVVVIVGGLDAKGLPYRVTLFSRSGHRFEAGEITELDAAGGAELLGGFDRSLAGVSRLVVRNASGEVVLAGIVNPPASPTP